MAGHSHHDGSGTATLAGTHIALVGSPNCGKTTLFNALTGLRAKTGNYPGVTVAKYEGRARIGDQDVVIEDLPGTYSLDPISLDEQVVTDTLDPQGEGTTPDALLVLLDATTLRRSLTLFSQVVLAGLPVCVVITFADELSARGGRLDVAALHRALGVPVVVVTAGDKDGIAALKERARDWQHWERPALAPPVDPAEHAAWVESVLTAAAYVPALADPRTSRIDNVLLHPVTGGAVFLAVMFAFFQVIFTLAAPLQGYVERLFAYLGGQAAEHIANPWLAGFVSDAVFGGVGGVVVFLPQIALLFLMISLLEGVGYMSRAAVIMDKLMSRFGLEGRAFVSLLSSVACAIPGIMATRTLPSARDRLATMMAAPLMTCSARLPVFVLLISMLVPSSARFGPFGAQGSILFGLYLLGALSSLLAAAAFKRFGRGHGRALPFYMEMPPYRLPSVRGVLLAVWDACRSFLRKVTHIILATTILLFLLLNLPARGAAEMRAAGVDPGDHGAAAAYVLDNSFAADIGRAVGPVFEPLGFDWRINIGVVSSLAAREVFVATMGQVAAAADPENPRAALEAMTVTDGGRAGEPLWSAPTIAALLVFFVYALQCISTIGVLRRETGGWKWPLIGFGYLFALAWTMAFLARTIVAALTG
ncbi:MAG: ferrous iron transporter B [Tetrasphaera sp.]